MIKTENITTIKSGSGRKIQAEKTEYFNDNDGKKYAEDITLYVYEDTGTCEIAIGFDTEEEKSSLKDFALNLLIAIK